jgi:hypothetical protein
MNSRPADYFPNYGNNAHRSLAASRTKGDIFSRQLQQGEHGEISPPDDLDI